MLYNVVLFVFIISVVSFSRLSEIKTLQVSRNFSIQYDTLNLFYDQIEKADEAARSFLYSPSERTLEIYLSHFNKSTELADELMTFIDREDHRWRIQLLKNMLITYQETFFLLKNNNLRNVLEYQIHYAFLVSTAHNISNTATQYYGLLTGQMANANATLLQEWDRQIFIYYSLILLLIIAGIIFSVYNIKWITEPIEHIVKNINHIKAGHFDFKAIKTYDREISILCDAFTDMAQSINGYVQSIKQNSELKHKLLEQENENLRISELLIQTELKALQSQVNPHFFFNMLSMVSKMAYIEKAYRTSEMMETVADLMRYSLDNSTKTSNLFNEMECLENYVTIQKQRFGHRLSFELSIAQHMPNIHMPGMILQPLVENAIVHGVANMTEGARIYIKTYCTQNNVYLEISDNGVGMEQTVLDAFLEGKELPGEYSSKKGTGIGLQNVLKRLEMFFDNRHNVLIKSDPDCGMAIIITLPFMNGRGDV